MTTEQLKNMKMHEVLEIDDFLRVRRVWGGWIYTEYYELAGGHSGCSQVFVPLSKSSEI